MKLLRGGASLAAIVLAAGAASAQVTDATPPTPAATGQTAPEQEAQAANRPVQADPAQASSGLADIVVTANRRAENVQRIAGSVVAVSGDTLERQGRSQLDDVLKNIPAASVNTGPRGFLVRVRGVGLDLPPTVGDPTVSVSKDDIVDDRTETTKAGFYDLDRVEVLRGPQGTLYGRNATGGAVNIITKNPVIGTVEGYALGELGNYNLEHVEGAVNVPAGDKLAFRVAGAAIGRDGYLTNGSNDNKVWAVRGKALFKPTDAITLVVGVEYTKIGGKGSSSAPAFGRTQPADPFDNTTPIFRAFGPPFFGYGKDGFLDGKNQKYYARLDVDLGFGVLTVLPGYQKYNEDYKYAFAGAATPATYTHTIVEETQKSGEARLASQSDSKIKWVIGTFGYRNTNFEYPLDVTTANYYNYHRKIETYAFFGQLTYPVTDTLRLTAGGRYTHDHKAYVSVQNSPIAYEPTTCTTAAPCSASRSWHNIDYKGGVEWDVADHILAYANVSTGFASGGYNFFAATASQGPFFKPEKITAYETGLKSRLFNNILQLNGSIFYYDYKDYQAAETLLSPAGVSPPTYLNVNTASARSYGGEFEAQLAPTRDDRLSVGVAYLNAKFRTFVGAANQQYNGTMMPNSPKWTVTGNYSHVFDLGQGVSITPQVSTRYTSTQIVAYAQIPSPPAPVDEAVQPHYFSTDASLSLSLGDGRLVLTGNVKNIENNAVKTNTFGPFDVALLAPRTYSLVGTVKF